STTGSYYPIINLSHAGGTQSSPAQTSNTYTLGSINFRGHTGSNWALGACIFGTATENYSAIGHGSRLSFATVQNGQTTPYIRMWLNDRYMHLLNNDLLLQNDADKNNGLGYYGVAKPFGSYNIDGPVLYGNSGGALGWHHDGVGADVVLTWLQNGNVGIGTSAPDNTLHVAGTFKYQDGTQNNNYVLTSDATGVASWQPRLSGGQLNRVAVWDSPNSLSYSPAFTYNLISGHLGVGTSSPSYPLDILNTQAYGGPSARYFNMSTSSLMMATPTQVSVRATGAFLSDGGVGGFYASSDARIKRIVGVSNALEDLATLMRIEVTDYQFRDTLALGGTQVKGVIAQQVEAVYPAAVSRQTNMIPDIYTLSERVHFDSAAHILTITLPGLPQAPLKAGETVRLLLPDGGLADKSVAWVRGNEFAVQEWERPVNAVFVYGRQVHDFRIVDYDRLHTLSISAIQELARQNADLRQTVDELKAALDKTGTDKDVLRQQLQRVLTRLDAVEAQLGLKASTDK
ncbi:MAG: tail fiber domain-containing protein, partial [Bacteroidetes bacterium]|nr:tail fiber domain-containing protein [Bacteroidota bacterium]